MHRKENVFSITETGNVKVVTELCSVTVVCMYCDEEFESVAFQGGVKESRQLESC